MSDIEIEIYKEELKQAAKKEFGPEQHPFRLAEMSFVGAELLMSKKLSHKEITDALVEGILGPQYKKNSQ